MSNRVDIPQTAIAYTLGGSSNPDQHRRVLHGSWLGLSATKIVELTGVRHATVMAIRSRARDELIKAGITIPTWLGAKSVHEDA